MRLCPKSGSPLRVLCLGAHSDDIEIGCGGTILRLLRDHSPVDVSWIVLSAAGERAREASESADLFLRKAAAKRVAIHPFRDGFFPYVGGEIKDYFECLKRELIPDLIFTHYRKDLHQDHRLVSELTWNTWRDHLILEYEIVKFDGDIGNPNVYVHLDQDICMAKIDHICKCFRTQSAKEWFDRETFLAMLRLRGVESNSPSKFSEAFYGSKILL
jgi:LmbE family N-acetylglucosaminyl deacetylase